MSDGIDVTKLSALFNQLAACLSRGKLVTDLHKSPCAQITGRPVHLAEGCMIANEIVHRRVTNLCVFSGTFILGPVSRPFAAPIAVCEKNVRGYAPSLPYVTSSRLLCVGV